MDYKVEKIKKNVAKIVITLTKEEWQKEVENAYNKNKNRYNVVGFRKGKAPRKVIEKTYGQNVFYEDALSDSFYNYYMEVLNKEPEIVPVEAPKLKVVKADEDGLIVEATIDLQPEVNVKQYTGFNIKVEPKEVTEKDVEAEINRLLEQNVRFVEVERPVKKDDIVNIDFTGSIDGKKFAGGSSKGYDLEIGSKSFIDNFEDQLIGLNVGDKKDVNVTFPKDYHAKDLAGKSAVFEVKVNSIKEKQYPTLNDAFISDVTEFDTLEEYKKDLFEQLKVQAQENAKFELEGKILDKVLENTEVELPESVIKHEIEHIIRDFEMRLMYQGLTLDAYLNYLNISRKQFEEERREDAIKNVKMSYALQFILNKEGIKLTDEEVNQKIAELAKNAKKSVEEYSKTIDDHRLGHIKNDILMNKLLEFLIKHN